MNCDTESEMVNSRGFHVRTAFLSSPATGMDEHRRLVLNTIERLGMHCIAMENFGARGDSPAHVCLRMIRDSDYFVGLMGTEHGTIVPDLGVSYSEMEYDTALALKRRPLMFLDEALRFQAGHNIESRQHSFAQRVIRERNVDFYVDAQDLAVRVATALHVETTDELRRAGARSLPLVAAHHAWRVPDPGTASPDIQRRIAETLVARSYDALLCRLDPTVRFLGAEIIVHSSENDRYPDGDPPGHHGISTWFKVGVFDICDEGIKVLLGGEEGLVDQHGFWDIGTAKDRTGSYYTHAVWMVGAIPYSVITDFKPGGDEWFGEPHLYVKFAFNGEPYAFVEYYAGVLSQNSDSFRGFLKLDDKMRRHLP